MKQAKVYNKSALLIERASLETCPRCKGYGELWLSASGWTRAKYARLDDSKLY